MNTAYTKAEAIAAGFVALGGTESLLIHARYPGFLFKVIETVNQAISCGGLLYRGADEQILYAGLDLLYVAKTDRVGCYARPASVEKSPNLLCEPIAGDYTSGANLRSYTIPARFDVKEMGWTTASDGKFIGVITRADRGLIVDRGFKVGIPIRSVTAKLATSTPRYSSSGPADGSWTDYNISGDTSHAIEFQLATVSGYWSNHIPLLKKKYLELAKTKYMESIDADSKIVKAYERAYTEHVASLSVTDAIIDQFTVYPHVGASDTKVRFTAHRRDPTPYQIGAQGLGDNIVASYVTQQKLWMFGSLRPVQQITASNGSLQWPASEPLDLVAARAATVVFSGPHDQSIGGFCCPHWLINAMGTVDNVSEQTLQALTPRDGTSARLPAQEPVFTLDAVPCEKVEMLPGQILPASAVFSVFGPRVMPDSKQNAAGSLDVSGRIEAEIASVLGNASLPGAPTGVNDTEREASAAAADSRLAARETAILAGVKHLTPFAAFIAETVAAIDGRARRALK